MSSRMTKSATVLIVVTLMAFASLSGARAEPPAGESPPAGGEGPIRATVITERTLAGYAQALLDGDTIDRFFAGDVVLTFGDTGQQLYGRTAVVAAINDLCHGVFAGQMTVTTSIVSGGFAATSGELSGTQVGVYQQIAATGRSMRVPYAAFYEVVNTLITSVRLDFSSADILRQLAIPSAGEDAYPHRSGRPF